MFTIIGFVFVTIACLYVLWICILAQYFSIGFTGKFSIPYLVVSVVALAILAFVATHAPISVVMK